MSIKFSFKNQIFRSKKISTKEQQITHETSTGDENTPKANMMTHHVHTRHELNTFFDGTIERRQHKERQIFPHFRHFDSAECPQIELCNSTKGRKLQRDEL